jgi:hypothetical protein
MFLALRLLIRYPWVAAVFGYGFAVLFAATFVKAALLETLSWRQIDQQRSTGNLTPIAEAFDTALSAGRGSWVGVGRFPCNNAFSYEDYQYALVQGPLRSDILVVGLGKKSCASLQQGFDGYLGPVPTGLMDRLKRDGLVREGERAAWACSYCDDSRGVVALIVGVFVALCGLALHPMVLWLRRRLRAGAMSGALGRLLPPPHH